MENDKSKSLQTSLDRREFFRYLGVGSAALGLASTGGIPQLIPAPAPREEEVIAHYPGARYFAGPWQLYLDEGNLGKRQEWYRQPPSRSAKRYEVRVPGCWQEYVPGLAGGIGWYFKEFALPAELKGQVLRLKFWAVDYFTEVWLNGEKLGEHEGGYTPFELDMTKTARLAEQNRLVVRVVDPPRPYAPKDRERYLDLVGLPGWEGMTRGVVDGFKFDEIPNGHQSWQEGFNFGGIWQPVELLATDPIYVSDIFVEPKFMEGAVVTHVEVSNQSTRATDGRVLVEIKSWKEGQGVAGHSSQTVRLNNGQTSADLLLRLRDPHAWSPEDPFLYVAEVTVEVGGKVRDRSNTRFGFREFTVKDGFFYLNGKRIFVKSGHHQGTYPTTLETPPTREFAYQEVRIFKEAGLNFCRLWVKPAPPEFLDAADELGLMLQEEPPLSLMVDSPRMLERSLREVREMTRRDRNRPSIVLWNMINENDPPVRYVRQQCEAVRELDSTRLITESAGGPSKYYLPNSKQGISYLTEHPYAGAPLSEDVYDYQQTRGVAGQLCFFSEYGFGGMNDLDSVLTRFKAQGKEYMEDYASHLALEKRREEAWADSNLLRQTFANMAGWREACQAAQADAVRLHTESMRSNPVCGGYNYVQVFDSNAIEIDGLVDFWRNNRKKSFYALQAANQPLLLVIRMTPMNGRLGQDIHVKVTLVNEERIAGRKRLTVGMASPDGKKVYTNERTVEAQPWTSVIFEDHVRATGKGGRYVVDAVLWEGDEELVRKEEFVTLFDPEDLKWHSGGVRVRVWDVEGKLEPYLRDRGISYERWPGNTEAPATIVVTPFTELWRNPEEFHQFVRLFNFAKRGCSVIFLGIPDNGRNLLTGEDINDSTTAMMPLGTWTIFPFHRLSMTDDLLNEQRIGPYAWGLTDVDAGVPLPRHPLFEGLPQTAIMGREYGNVVPVHKIETDWRTSEETGSTVQIYDVDEGKLILTSLNLLPNLTQDALAEKLLSNLVNYAASGLPAGLSPEDPYGAESEAFEIQGYKDCFKKYIQGRR